MLLDACESQLVLVDYQVRLMPAIHDASAILKNALRLAQIAGLLQVPCCATEQCPQNLGETVVELKAVLEQRRCTLLTKNQFSAVSDGLSELLRPQHSVARSAQGNARSLPKHLQKALPTVAPRGSIVLAGCEAHVCVLQTALELLDEDFDVWVVSDACGSRTERNRDAAFDRLAAAGVELVTTEMLAFEWLRGATHPQFRAVQALIK